MKNEPSRPDPPAVLRNPEEQAVQEAVRAIQADVQALLHQHFEEVRLVLPQLVKSSLKKLEPEIRDAAAKAEVRLQDSRYEKSWRQNGRERWKDLHPAKRYGILLAFALIATATVLWTILSQPAAPVATSNFQPPLAPTDQKPTAADIIAAIRAKREAWDHHYRSGGLAREIKLLLSDTQTPTATQEVRDVATRYEKGPVLTTLQDEDRLVVALVQAFLAQESGNSSFTVDGVLSWKQYDKPKGQSAPHLKRYLNQKYLPKFRTTMEDLLGEPDKPEFGRLLASLERALLVDVLEVER